MSHHYSGPDFGFPHGDARLDLTDLYAFPKPGDAGKSILIMNVHPSAVVEPAGAHHGRAVFARGAVRAQDRHGRRCRRRYRLPGALLVRGRTGRRPRRCAASKARRPPGPATAGRSSSKQHPSRRAGAHGVTEAGDYRFFAGWRSDPFFFDTRGALNNCSSPVTISSPTRTCAASCWKCPTPPLGPRRSACGPARWTARAGVGSRRTAARCPRKPSSSSARRGMPTSPASRRTMPVSSPSSRTRWSTRAGMRRRKRCGWRGRCCRTCCPTIPTRPASFPGNGRTLTDDAGDAFLAILTNGKVTEDKVGPHGDLLVEFPYLGPPHDPRPDRR